MRPRILDLALGQGMEPQNPHPSGQRIRQAGNEQDVGGTGQDESPRSAAAVDGGLERGEDLGHPLDLVKNGLGWKRVDEADRIPSRRGGDGLVVE